MSLATCAGVQTVEDDSISSAFDCALRKVVHTLLFRCNTFVEYSRGSMWREGSEERA